MLKGKYKIRENSIAWHIAHAKPFILFFLFVCTVVSFTYIREMNNAYAAIETKTETQTEIKTYTANGWYHGDNIFITEDGNAWEYTTEMKIYNGEPVTISFNDNGTESIYDDIITEIKIQPQTWDVPMSDELQAHIVSLCEEHNIVPEIVIAMIQKESNYNADIIGDNGTSFGLMQIREMYHEKRMEKLGCTDLLDPFQNVTVGIDIISEKMEKYDTVEEALTAYNAGDAGAYSLYFSKGIYANDYAIDVMEIANSL